MIFYCTVALLVQAVFAAAIFDKFSYYCAACYFVLSAWAVHYQMPWAWQASLILLGVLAQLSVYATDIWEEVANPFKYLSTTTTFVALALLVFCVTFLYRLNVDRVHIQNFFRSSSIYIVLLLIFILVSCIWSAITITDYFAPKAVTASTFKITKIYSKNLHKAGTTNYLEANIKGVDHKFVLTSVAYSVLKLKKEITVNLWHTFSGRLIVKNDFLRQERGPWRLRVLGNILFVVLLIAIICGVIFYLSTRPR